MKDLPTAEELRNVFAYNPETGALHWNVQQSRNVPVGAKAGSLASNGRLLVRYKLRQMYAHRVAWCIYYGQWPTQNVSAKNGDYTDLRIANYVEISTGQTAQKGGPRRTSTSGMKGVSWDRRRGKWIASITRNYKFINLGRYDTKEEAKAAYDKAATDMGLFVMEDAERERHYSNISRRTKMRVLWTKTLKTAGGITGWKTFEDFCREVPLAEDRYTQPAPIDPNQPVGPGNWQWLRREVVNWSDPVEKAKAHREHRGRFRIKFRDKQLRKSFGMTIDDYTRMLSEQSGVCAICFQPETSLRWGNLQPLAVDHCHTSGKVRGLLCHKCNVGIGSFSDDPDRLMRAAEYVKRHAPTTDRSNVIPIKRKE